MKWKQLGLNPVADEIAEGCHIIQFLHGPLDGTEAVLPVTVGAVCLTATQRLFVPLEEVFGLECPPGVAGWYVDWGKPNTAGVPQFTWVPCVNTNGSVLL